MEVLVITGLGIIGAVVLLASLAKEDKKENPQDGVFIKTMLFLSISAMALLFQLFLVIATSIPLLVAGGIYKLIESISGLFLSVP